jgi:hypothetical protein
MLQKRLQLSRQGRQIAGSIGCINGTTKTIERREEDSDIGLNI